MKRLVFLLFAIACTWAEVQAQAAPSAMQTTTDQNAVLELLQGKVDLYGQFFGPVSFQRGLLNLAQSKAITVRVLTSPASAPNMKPLKAVGAQVNVLQAQFTGGLIVVQGKAVIYPMPGGKFAYLTRMEDVIGVQTRMEQYWRVSTRY